MTLRWNNKEGIFNFGGLIRDRIVSVERTPIETWINTSFIK